MIEACKPVFGVCRGLQELNVLFGGTLRTDLADAHKHPEADDIPFEDLFGHHHSVDLVGGGMLAPGSSMRIAVNSVHEQGIDRLGAGLKVEAVESGGDLVEGFSSPACGAPVLAVQWHPECDADHCSVSRGFFELLGTAAARSLQLAA
jgi:putative glutamine amidotransferase